MKLKVSKTNRQNIEDIYPLSTMQEGMLFESLYAPESGVYFEQITCTFTGSIDVKAFESAWQQVVEKHSIFRTAFVWESLSEPVQVVYRQVDVSVVTYNWEELSTIEQQAQLETFLSSQRQEGFQLSAAPLMRLYLIKLDWDTYEFVWCHHHLLLDGWSLPLVFKDLLEFYQAISQGVSLPVQPTLGYRNYIAWLQQQDQDLAKEFWRQKLQGFSAPTSISVEKPLSSRESDSGYGEQQIQLTVSSTAAIGSFARQHQLTINNLVQATWGLLLCRYSQETDVVFGATVSGRPPQLAGVESMVGLFINTVPVRVQISDDTQVLGLLKDLQGQQVESEQFSYSSLVEIQGLSDVNRGTSLFDSIVVFENYPVDTAVSQGNGSFSLSNFRGIEQTNYPLTLLAASGEQFLLKVSYDTSRFEHGAISRMLGHFVTLLEAIVANPGQPIPQLPMLTLSEQHQLLVEWNDTQVDYPDGLCIHQLFEEQVRRTPDAVAVVFENQQLTYHQLNVRANQLAHYLRSLGVSPDVLVGICVQRSLEMVVGLLGILKAGGAYLPLDPEYPTERLSFMLEDSQVSLLLTQQGLVDKLPQHQARVVYLDSDWEKIAQNSESNPLNNVTSSNLTYVIYTSGSTGEPKGVLVNHNNVTRLFAATEPWYDFNSQDVWTLFHSYAFDFSVWEIWGALLYGGRLVVVPYLVTRSPESFYELLCQEKVTILNQTPSAFCQLISAEQSQATVGNLSLRLVIFGGEALEINSLQPWFDRHGDQSPQLVNMYGITETTVHVTYRLLSKGDLNGKGSVIGRPIPDLQMYVLDEHLQPVPIGVPGEMYVGGAGVTRGYLNRPELTAGRFISNPFQINKEPGEQGKERLYKTGDLARYLADGNIEYLGRIDNQVKIRGFRIELGEIEAVLSQHEDVQTSCVIAREDTPGDKRLVAYIVPQPEITAKVSILRSFLKSKLPEYMVPAAIVILESLPLTPNGKVDRRALKAPEPSNESSSKYVAPRNPIEEILSLIWTKVLKVETVGIDDNFFELGGHSLLATQLMSRVRSNFKVELPLRSLFAAPTIKELSENIQQLQQENLELSAPPILARGENAEIPLSYAQQRLWFLDQYEPNSASYNIPGGLRLVGTLCFAALEESLREIINRHEALRTNFITIDGKAAQIIQTQKNWTVAVVDYKELSRSEQEIATEKLGQQLALVPFDLAKQCLLRATLVVLSESEHILLVCMHHIVSDGWSMGVFIEEFSALYNAYSQGLASPLLPLPIQYGDFAIWQREWLQGTVVESQLSYWQQQLADAPRFLPLPTDRPRPAVQTFAGAHIEFGLSVELTAKLTKLSQELGVTLFMTLLAAYDTLIYRYTGVSDILVGSPIANRERSEIEGLIGFFVNTLVLRTDVSGDPSFQELLPRIREMALSAYAHQDLPFEMLVEALQPERDLSHTPLFQVMFVLQNAPMSEIELSGLSVSPLPIETATAKFDLTLSMENTATGLMGVWEYNTDLFDATTIERMTGHLITLIEGIVANPQQRISQLPMLTPSEQRQLLVEWNDTQVDYPDDLCIHQLFEEQVRRTPDAVAVVFENQQLTYHQLNVRANQLAHYLRSLGVSGDVLVGICVQRSLEMVVGLLGILKAGGAYLPLDQEYPTERLSFMLEDSQVSLLLTQQGLVDKLPQHQARVVYLDSDWEKIAPLSQDNLISGVQASNLAYVIYTSGSTGQPKGVMIAYKGLLNLVFWHQRAFKITSLDKATQLAGTAFDAAVWELWPYLTAGASIYLVKSEIFTFPVNLRDWLISQKITISFMPTPLAQELLSLEWPTESLAMRYILTGGDKLHQYPSVLVPFQLVNNYGPTENSVVTTSGLVVAKEQDKISPTIGRPIDNTQVYILDKYLQPVPIGIPGELHIGGAGLARGYLNRRELTQEKFIPNPFDNSKVKSQNSKLYKTGDLGRYLPDGNIEYLGRIDNQVKIRGFRIELGEIEAVLSQHEDVQTSCVIAREDIPGNKRLVAYIVPEPQITPKVSVVRSFLKTQLPEYMIPGAIVILESLPLTPNGKIDRRALPAPEWGSVRETSLVAPQSGIEEKLAQIWGEVLRVEKIGIHDNFFELGGDSILSIQIITRAKLVGIELTLKQLFANQTIAQLATVAGTTKALLIEQGLVTGAVALTPIQHWFFEQKLPEKQHFNQSFLLTVPSDFNREILESAWQELLKHHDALRLRFREKDSTWQQIHADVTEHNTICHFDFSSISDSEQKAAIESRANSLQASLNLSENLVQIALFWLGNQKRARLLIVIHHLVVDGVSWRILLEDLQTAYQQLSENKAIQLPEKTTSFKDWSQQLSKYATSDALKSELAYWLRTSDEISSLPVDYPQGMNTVASTRRVSVSLNTCETQALLQDVPKAYRTQINDILLTALVMVLSRWTNSKSVLFNLEGHGREDIIDGVDLSRTIGWFTTIFPVVIKLETTDIEEIGNALKSVKSQLRAIPNKGIGYGLLRYLVDGEVSAQLHPMKSPEISFNYLGQFTQVLNTSSLMQMASESSGESQSSEGQRHCLLDINAIIVKEQLQIDWTYSSNIHYPETIETIAEEFVDSLQEIIAHCLSPENVGYTPTDFPLIKLNQLELDGVLARVALLGERGKINWQNIQDIYPLSTMQEGMLFESLYAPESGVYFEQITCTFTGSIDVKAFESAWQQVVEKHSIFRTAFVWESLSEPVQVVYRQVDVSVVTYNWEELSTIEQQAQLETFLSSQRQEGFQLSAAPLMRLYLIKLDWDTYEFVWCHHHLLLDGWSLPLVFKDLLEFYQAISQGVSLPVQPTLGYRNYIAWLQQQDQDLAKEFWRQKLQGFSAPTSISVEKPLSSRESDSGYGEQQIQLTVSSTAAIGSFARQHQLTINNLVQATWGLLLCRYSQETDVVFGATVSGRPPQLAGVESMVGLFINTVPVRVQISDDTQVLGLLKDLQGQQVESEQFSYSSLVEIQGLSDVNRGTSLFDSIVVFENYPVDTAVSQGNGSFSLSNFRGIEQTNYPLTLLAASGEQFLLKVSYDTSRFEHGAISRMLGHFVTLLEAIVANPGQPILQLPMLTLSEQRQLLVEWNDTQVDYPDGLCIHQLFEEQVRRTPDAVAVVFENQQLTYHQLNVRANQLAHYLRSLGVSPDVLVGICVQRSLEMVVGLLGILKAGGAYLPLDQEYPTERLSFMLEDSQVSLLLTQQGLVDKLPQHQARVVYLDSDWEKIAPLSQDNLISGVQASNLGYVIYTSGSTGTPKGVAMNQFALCNLLQWQLQNLTISSGAKTLQFAPVSFDVSFQEMFSTWCNGGTLLLIQEELRREPLALLALLQEQAVERLFLPFVGLQQLAEVAVASESVTSNLKEIITAGEQLQITPAISNWLILLSDCTLHNHYGPSESHVVTTFTLTNSANSWPLLPPIGRPIANTQIYILDEFLQPVPIGVPGELYIGGASLARGYFNRKELTEEKFIPNPFQKSMGTLELLSRGGKRLYKTGDLARYLADGNIEYLGRIDNQVKIRGFRIELGEIEALLSQHEDVQASCVIAREDTPGDKRLVAYIVPQPQITPKVSVVRSFLKSKLPEYMIPSAIVILESLPLTPNGKVDRRALPLPFNPSSDTFVFPRNTVELLLVQIWSKVLKVENVGVKDNFFDLGGHSLLAPYLMAQIKQEFGKDIPLAMLFQHPTIEDLASVVQKDTDASGWSSLVAIQPTGSNPPFFCLPGAGGFPFYLYNLARCLGSDQPFYSFQSQGGDGELSAISQVEDIAAHYIQAMQAVQPQGPYFLAGHSFGGKVVFEMAQQLVSQGEVVALVVILDTTAPFAQAKEEELDDATWLIQTAKLFQIAFTKDLDMDGEALLSLAPEEQFKYVLDYFKMLDIMPPDTDTTYLKQLLQAFKADGSAEYVPQHIHPIAITLFRASEFYKEEPTVLDKSGVLVDSDWGWNAFSSEPVDIQFVPGTHVTMMNQPHVQVLAERLKACIKQAMKKMEVTETLN